MSITKNSKLTAILLLIIVCLTMGVACSAGDGNFYTVKFESNGGTQYSEVVAEGGTRVNLPTPEKTDSEFVGWYLNPEFEGDIASGAYAVTGDVTLYAKWNTKTYNVKFESNGGTQYSDVLVESGTRVKLPTPERYASIFSGWYLR